MDINDYVLYKNKDGSFQSGGYKLDSSFLENNYTPITSYNINENEIIQKGGNPALTEVFSNLAVPAGLFVLQRIANGKYNEDINSKDDKPELIEDSLYDKLLKLATINNYKKQPRTPKNLDNKKTKKLRKNKSKQNKSKKLGKK
jgi:hypothetical protein